MIFEIFCMLFDLRNFKVNFIVINTAIEKSGSQEHFYVFNIHHQYQSECFLRKAYRNYQSYLSEHKDPVYRIT
jgi:hypothetical protein